jgi:hypothetical protein
LVVVASPRVSLSSASVDGVEWLPEEPPHPASRANSKNEDEVRRACML